MASKPPRSADRAGSNGTTRSGPRVAERAFPVGDEALDDFADQRGPGDVAAPPQGLVVGEATEFRKGLLGHADGGRLQLHHGFLEVQAGRPPPKSHTPPRGSAGVSGKYVCGADVRRKCRCMTLRARSARRPGLAHGFNEKGKRMYDKPTVRCGK